MVLRLSGPKTKLINQMGYQICFNMYFRLMDYFCLMRYASALVLLFAFASCDGDDPPPSDTPPVTSIPGMNFKVSKTYPHDTSSFTEGLNIYNGQVLESTGNHNRSFLLLTDLKTGKVIKQAKLDSIYFGEGTVMLRDTIYQLTWREKKVFVYNKEFKKINELQLNYEGWGLTTNGSELIATDGSSNLYFYEPSTFRLLRTQGVSENGTPIANLNEIEFVNGFIYANQWQTNYIFKIDANSGAIAARMDLTDLFHKAMSKYANIDVLNGIAYDSSSKKLYVTGKYWPEIYELEGSW
jgi:glutaminyl-peptide cyclotransferase